MSIDGLNIVALGENFPVQSIDIKEFAHLGAPTRERVRLPVVLEASVGRYGLSVLPERFQFGLDGGVVPETDIESIAGGGAVFLDYVGKRTISAIGHNAKVYLGASEETRMEVLDHFMRVDRIEELLKTPRLGLSQFQVFFDGARGERGRLRVDLAERADAIGLSFNYHFDLSVLDVQPDEAVHFLADSVEQTLSIVGSFPMVSDDLENAAEGAQA